MSETQTIPDGNGARSIWRWNEAGTGWVEIIFPKWAKRLVVRFQGQAGFLSHTAAPGEDFKNAIEDQAEDVTADSQYAVPITPGQGGTQARAFVRVAAGGNITAIAEANPQG